MVCKCHQKCSQAMEKVYTFVAMVFLGTIMYPLGILCTSLEVFLHECVYKCVYSCSHLLDCAH